MEESSPLVKYSAVRDSGALPDNPHRWLLFRDRTPDVAEMTREGFEVIDNQEGADGEAIFRMHHVRDRIVMVAYSCKGYRDLTFRRVEE